LEMLAGKGMVKMNKLITICIDKMVPRISFIAPWNKTLRQKVKRVVADMP